MNSQLLKKAFPHLIAILVFLVVALVYCRPVLEGKVVYQSDVQQYKEMARQAEEYKNQNGRYPLWIENAFAGMPAYTIKIDGTPRSFGILINVMMLFMPDPISYFFLACVCFYILMYVLKVNPWIAVMASLAYTYCSYDPIIIGTGHVTKMWAIAFAPAVIASMLLLFQRKYWWGTCLLAFFFASELVTQHLQIVFYTAICMFFLAIGYVINAARTGKISRAVIPLGLTALACAIGYLTSVGATFADAEYTRETMRGGRTELTKTSSQESRNGLSYDYAFMWSYGIGETMTLVVPNAAGGGGLASPEIGDNSKFADRASQELGMPEEQALQFANGIAYWGPQPSTSGPVYLGAVICFLCLFALVLLKDWMKWSLVVTIIAGIVMAWGNHFTAINYFLFDHLPYYNKFRSPSTALFLPQLATPILVALGLQQLLTGSLDSAFLWKKFKTTAYVAGGLILLIVGYYFTASYKAEGINQYSDASQKQNLTQAKAQQLVKTGVNPDQALSQAQASANSILKGLDDDRQSMYASDMLRTIVLIVIAAVLLAAFLKGRIKPLVLLAGLLVLSTYDLLAVSSRYLKAESYVDPADLENGMQPTAADQQIMSDPDKNYRVLDMSDRGNAFQDARASNFHNSLGGYSPAKLGLYQDLIEHQLSKGTPQVLSMLNTKYVLVADPKSGQPVAQRNPDVYGPCWFVKGIHFVKNGDEEMQALDSIPLKDSAIIQQKYAGQIPFQPVADSAASIRLVNNKLETIQYKTSANTNQFAVLSEVYYDKGWDAYIDGKRADYLRVNYLLRGIPVPAGDHTIDFKFEPESYKKGYAIASVFCYLILLLFPLAWWGDRRTKKNSATAAT